VLLAEYVRKLLTALSSEAVHVGLVRARQFTATLLCTIYTDKNTCQLASCVTMHMRSHHPVRSRLMARLSHIVLEQLAWQLVRRPRGILIVHCEQIVEKIY